MNKELKYLLRDILHLDSVFGVLKAHERICLWGCVLEWEWSSIPPRVKHLLDFLRENPIVLEIDTKIRVGQDRLTYAKVGEEVILIGEYRKKHKVTADLLRVALDR